MNLGKSGTTQYKLGTAFAKKKNQKKIPRTILEFKKKEKETGDSDESRRDGLCRFIYLFIFVGICSFFNFGIDAIGWFGRGRGWVFFGWLVVIRSGSVVKRFRRCLRVKKKAPSMTPIGVGNRLAAVIAERITMRSTEYKKKPVNTGYYRSFLMSLKCLHNASGTTTKERLSICFLFCFFLLGNAAAKTR